MSSLGVSSGGGGGRALASGAAGSRQIHPSPAPPAQVSLVKGYDRREIVHQALKKIEDQILSGLRGRRILIKPSFVQVERELWATHVDAVRGILDFLRPHGTPVEQCQCHFKPARQMAEPCKD